MAEPRPVPALEPSPKPPDHGSGRRLRFALPLVGAAVAVAAVLAVIRLTSSGDGRVGEPPSPSGGVSVASVAPSTSRIPTSSPRVATPSAPIASSASPFASTSAPSRGPASALIAVVDGAGGLATMDAIGGSLVSHAVPGVSFALPAWSPDGTRVAAIAAGPDATSIDVFTVRGTAADRAEPTVIYRSQDRPPFYLYWTPDSQRVSFLATEPASIALRIAPTDGSAPLDGSGPGAIVRQGAPLYFDWEAADRLFLHVGVGSTAFVGDVGLDGAAVAPALPGTGDFRLASSSRDGRYLAYSRGRADLSGEIVVASRDGTGEHSLPVFGPAAFLFDPTGDSLAFIAADQPATAAAGFPLGALRLIDARSGAVRTLVDGSVVGFFWAPDGRTIATIRVVRAADQSTAAATTASAASVAAAASAATAAATASPPPTVEVRLGFVDVASGVVRAERPVLLGDAFVGNILPYFDQYALSHHLWSPDSASILLPLDDTTGRTHLTIVPADGAAMRTVTDGVSGFWSP